MHFSHNMVTIRLLTYWDDLQQLVITFAVDPYKVCQILKTVEANGEILLLRSNEWSSAANCSLSCQPTPHVCTEAQSGN